MTVIAVLLLLLPAASYAAPCESLTTALSADGVVTAAQVVKASAFKAPGGGDAGAFARLPAFCRVEVTLRPSPDSDIKVEIWLPVTGWNGKFQAVGNGGWAGSLSYGAMAEALARGYATSSTDTGHRGGSARFALNQPERLIDYSYRAVHGMAAAGKTIIAAYYGDNPRQSYFNGCSTGGRQALVSAQRFPADFDGIIAGAAANPKSHLDGWRIWMAQAMLKDTASFIPPSKHGLLHSAVMNACDHVDGVKDGLIENPMRCEFDPQTLACTGKDTDQCLTQAQVVSASIVMRPVTNRKTGELIFPRLEPGTEANWSRLLGGPQAYETAVDQYNTSCSAIPIGIGGRSSLNGTSRPLRPRREACSQASIQT